MSEVVQSIWLDGKIVSRGEFSVAPDDEMLLYGRGLFETTRTFDGIPWLWPGHLERLRQSARVIGIRLADDQLPSERDIADWVGRSNVVVRLNVGQVKAGQEARVWMVARPLPEEQATVRLMVAHRISP